MSKKTPARERCIVALDVPCGDDALRLADELGAAAAFYKVGLELFAAGDGRVVATELLRRGKKVFVDLKLYDVPVTVTRAARQVAALEARFLTVHGDEAIMRAAVEGARGSNLQILAVTALTSLDEIGLRQLGYAGTMREFVLARAKQAQQAGCAGVICSGHEVRDLRAACGEDFILVTPGVRRADDLSGAGAHDQKRTATPAAIIAAGGDYLVIGRPIRDAAAPRAALEEFVKEAG